MSLNLALRQIPLPALARVTWLRILVKDESMSARYSRTPACSSTDTNLRGVEHGHPLRPAALEGVARSLELRGGPPEQDLEAEGGRDPGEAPVVGHHLLEDPGVADETFSELWVFEQQPLEPALVLRIRRDDVHDEVQVPLREPGRRGASPAGGAFLV